jgi:hypothetical protein
MGGGGGHTIAAESFSKALFKLSNFFYCFLSNRLALCLGEQVPTPKVVLLHSHIRQNICQYFASVSEDLQWRSAHAGFIFMIIVCCTAHYKTRAFSMSTASSVSALLCSRCSVLVVFVTDFVSYCISYTVQKL